MTVHHTLALLSFQKSIKVVNFCYDNVAEVGNKYVWLNRVEKSLISRSYGTVQMGKIRVGCVSSSGYL